MDCCITDHNLGFIFAILSALFFGLGNSYWKVASRDVEVPFLMFFRNFFVVIILGLIWVFVCFSRIQLNGLIQPQFYISTIIKTIGLCLLSSFGLFFYLKSLKYAPVSFLIPISSLNIFSIMTAVFYFKEEFFIHYYFSVFLSLIGISFLVKNNFINPLFVTWNKGAIFSLLAALFWGVSYALFKNFVVSLGIIPFTFILELSVLIFSSVWIIISHDFSSFKQSFNRCNMKHFAFLSFLLLGGSFFYNAALYYNSIIQLNLVGPIQLFFSVLVGVIFLKEKLQLSHIIGIFILLVALMITSFGNNLFLLDDIS